MKVEVKLTGVDGVLDTLRQLPPEVVSKRGGPVKTALRKGANVIAKQARANLDVVTSNATSTGKRESTGFLKKQVIASRGKVFGIKGERYLVRVRKRAYQRAGKKVTAQKTGALLEYGSSKQPAEPWLRPAFQARAREAISTIESELVAAIDRVVKRLSKGK